MEADKIKDIFAFGAVREENGISWDGEEYDSFVDDISGEQEGTDEFVVQELSGFTGILVCGIRADKMEVSGSKSLVSASRPELGLAIEHALAEHQPKPNSSTLGPPASTQVNPDLPPIGTTDTTTGSFANFAKAPPQPSKTMRPRRQPHNL